MKTANFLCVLFLGCVGIPICQAQQPPCDVLTDEGRQKTNGSRICIKLKVTEGRVDFDRTQSVFKASEEFKRRSSSSISAAQTEENLFAQLSKLLNNLERPYRLALSDEERALDDKGQLTDEFTGRVRTASKPWDAYLQLLNDWVETQGKPQGLGDIFPESEATLKGGLMYPVATAQDSTALFIYGDNDYDPDSGVIRFAVADPINNWNDATQVELKLPGVPEGSKKESRLKRLKQILEPLSGTPRCLDCITAKLNSFYRRLGLEPNVIVDNKGSSPLILKVIESSRIVGISWLSLEDDDIDKVLYCLLTTNAFKSFLKNRTRIKTQKSFDYIQETGRPGPYVNGPRLQIQQLLLSQIGYSVSTAFALNRDAPETSNYNLTIQRAAAEDDAAADTSTNETPDTAPATANPEGVVSSHEQEKEKATEFEPAAKPTPKEEDKEKKDKKRYVGGGLDYRPGQGVRFFGLGQVSRFPFLPDSVNNASLRAGGQGSDGALGSTNYFGDYLFFNTLHRRFSLQLTVSSDLEANRNLNGTLTDERRHLGLARLEFEPFRDWSGSLLRFFAEGRRATVILQDIQPEMKQNLTTLELGSLYLFESSEVENPRRIRLEPKLRMGLGLAVGEPRFNKWLATGNFHQMLPSRLEADISGRFELASRATPRFELPSLGGAEVIRGFRRDDGLGRKLWSLQSELWIPLPVGDETSQGLKAMLRDKVKLAPFVDVAGLYEAVNTSSGLRKSTGLGLRFIYNPIIFKIDYGYGFGPAATGGSRGKFHFSVGSNLPF